MQAFRVGYINDFKNRGKKVLLVDNEEVGIFRIDNNFYAWKNICPHQGGPVCQGRLYPLVKENLNNKNESKGRFYDEDNLKDFRIVVQFQATDYEDAEDFVYSMNPKDWLEHLEEKGVL